MNEQEMTVDELRKTIQRDNQIVMDLRKRLKEVESDAENLANRLMEEHTLLRECRNELCVRCGNYVGAFQGAYDGCKWKGLA